uniref:MATH domain-containing protein n=1 Tax=Strongyloides venezuelensis TaxID=75913 RepID=A0A0K0EU49_STRVS
MLGKSNKVKTKYGFSILNDKEEGNVSEKSRKPKEFAKDKGLGFPKFIKKDFLDKLNGLLDNDTLTIICELSIVNESWNYQCRRMSIKEMIPRQRLLFDLGNILDFHFFGLYRKS